MLRRREFLRALGWTGASALVGSALRAAPEWARLEITEPELIVRNTWPEHWETTVATLGLEFYTRNRRFFVRSHFPAPAIDASSWRLEVSGLVERPLSLSLAELRKLPQADAVHTLECAGNGRGLFRLPSTSGTQWERGAVGNARWAGPLLATLLDRAGVRPEAKHVWFEAADRAPLPEVPPFLRSIPLGKAAADTLLALRMNGEALPRLHGAPARVIVPGWYGMASTKWVTRIRLEASPSDNHFIARGYRYVYPGEDASRSAPVEEIQVKSLITSPLEGGELHGSRARIEGFAWAGSSGVRLVEVSSDDGASWAPGRFETNPMGTAWRRWSFDLPLGRPGPMRVRARATDGNGASQPAEARPNAAGYGNNSIHVVSFRVG